MRNDTAAVSHTATNINVWPLNKLIPYARNPRKNDAAVGQMVASIREFGAWFARTAKSSTGTCD